MTSSSLLKYLELGAVALIAVFAPAKAALVTVMALPLVDLLLALVVAVRCKDPVTSQGLKRTVAKIVMYEVATILAFATEQFLTGDMVPCMKLVTALIGLTELKSCLEHLDTLAGKSMFRAVLDRLALPHKEDDEP